jgi:hypothetical protein
MLGARIVSNRIGRFGNAARSEQGLNVSPPVAHAAQTKGTCNDKKGLRILARLKPRDGLKIDRKSFRQDIRQFEQLTVQPSLEAVIGVSRARAIRPGESAWRRVLTWRGLRRPGRPLWWC